MYNNPEVEEKKSVDMNDFKNTYITEKIILSLINVTKNKTSSEYAWTVVKAVLKNLTSQFDFINFINIRRIDNGVFEVIIDDNLNNVDHKLLGKAIQNIIDFFKKRMGERAGFYFIKDLKNDLGEENCVLIKKMGVDFRLTDLQNEISTISSTDYKIKDDVNSNIAFIEKN